MFPYVPADAEVCCFDLKCLLCGELNIKPEAWPLHVQEKHADPPGWEQPKFDEPEWPQFDEPNWPE